jgi:hypothetical protein
VDQLGFIKTGVGLSESQRGDFQHDFLRFR